MIDSRQKLLSQPTIQAERSRRSLQYFADTFLPHYLTAPPSKLHIDLVPRLSALHTVRGQRVGRIAPRGAAKSFWVSQAMPLRAAVCGFEPYTAILSDSREQAEQLLSAILEELRSNEALLAAFPQARPVEERSNRVMLANGTIIHALGTGQRIRGRRNRQARPSLIIVDDPQSNRDIHSATERTHAWEWFTREVIRAGNDQTNIVVVGTALHREAIAVRVQTTPLWEGRTYKSIIQWPKRMELWDKWERLLSNLADPDRVATAAAFYAANKKAMDEGAEVLWPEYRPLANLMATRAEIGPLAFDGEEQGKPSAGGINDWPAEFFEHEGFWFNDWPTDVAAHKAGPMGGSGPNIYARFGFYDPAGHPRKKPGDYHALALLAITRDGDLWLEVQQWHGEAMESLERVVGEFHNFGCQAAGFETNYGGSFLVSAIAQTAERLKCPMLPLYGIPRVHGKEQHIRSLSPYLFKRSLHLRRGPGGTLTHGQFLDFPTGVHDDGIDAAAAVVQLAREQLR